MYCQVSSAEVKNIVCDVETC